MNFCGKKRTITSHTVAILDQPAWLIQCLGANVILETAGADCGNSVLRLPGLLSNRDRRIIRAWVRGEVAKRMVTLKDWDLKYRWQKQ